MEEEGHATRAQLLNEVTQLRQRVAALEAARVEGERAETALWQSGEVLSTLYQAGQQIGQSLDTAVVFQCFYEWVSRLMAFHSLFVSSFNAEEQLIRCVYAIIEGQLIDPGTLPPLPLEPEGRGTQSRVIRTGQSLCLNDYQAYMQQSVSAYQVDPQGILYQRDAVPEDGEVTRSALLVPMFLSGQVVGVIQVMSHRRAAFTEDNLRVLESLASQVAVAFNNAYLYQQAQAELAERRRVEAALRESENKFRSITENAADFIFIKDQTRRYTFVNPAMRRLFGAAADSVLGKTPEELFGPDQSRVVSALDDRTFAGETVNEIRGLHISGVQYFFNTIQTPLVTENGAVTAIMGIVRDVTERKKAEEELAIFKKALDSSSDAIGMATPDGKHYYQNRAFDEMFGDIGDDPPATLYVDEAVGREVFQTIMAGDEWSGEVAMVGKDKAVLDILLRAYVVKENGQVVALVGAHTDITARKRAKEMRLRLAAQVREQAQQMEQILATVPAGVLLLNAEGRVLQANPMAAQYLSLLGGVAVGDMLMHLGHLSLRELLIAPSTSGLWREVKAASATFEVVARPVESDTEPEHWVLVLKDVTREREIQAQLQQQERLAVVGQLAAGIAHDFNNIMASIVLYAQMAVRSQTLPECERGRMEIIVQQAWHATRLIQQILDFSRRAVLERKPLDLLPLLKEQVKLLQRTLPEHIRIELVSAPGAYIIHTDPTRIQQMLTNLAVNARDAMPGGGTLRIELARVTIASGQASPLPEMLLSQVQETGAAEWIRLTVADTGTGMTPEVRAHLFEPFFTTKEPGQGTGLGLAQVYGIVGVHGGYIDVETEVGAGTAFSIYLPALEASPTQTPASRTSVPPQGQGETVLVVEDEATLRMVLVEILEMLNYRAIGAANGREALALMEAQDSEIALVLSDVVMPEMGGAALFHALRARGFSTPVILLTGHPMNKEMESLHAQGLAAWLLKPPDIEQLAQAVAHALHQ